MSGDFFKVSKQFHACVEDSLAAVTSGDDRKRSRRFKHITAVAASIAIVAIVTVFSAHAAGVINLDQSFQKIFGLEGRDEEQKYAQSLLSAPEKNIVPGDISAKMLQCINDEHTAVIMLEFEADKEIFNPTIHPDKYEFKIGDEIIEGYQYSHTSSSSIVNKKQSIEEGKAEYDKRMSDQLNGIYEDDSAAEEQFKKYYSTFSNKAELMLTLESEKNILGKDISISIKNLKGSGEESKDINIECDINFSWKLSSEAKTRTIKTDKVIDGIPFKEIILTPFGVEVKFAGSIEQLKSHEDDFGAVIFRGVKYKDGTTEYINMATGSFYDTGYKEKFGNTIINVDEIASIYVGLDCTEVPFD